MFDNNDTVPLRGEDGDLTVLCLARRFSFGFCVRARGHSEYRNYNSYCREMEEGGREASRRVLELIGIIRWMNG